MKVFWRWFDRVIDGMAGLAGVVLVFMTLAVCYGITMRYFFRSPPIWVVQTTEYSLLWMVFLATTWLLKEKGHVSVDIIYAGLDSRMKARVDMVMYAAAGAACCVLLFFSVAYMCECISRGVTDVRALTVPKWSVFIVVPVGLLFLTIQFFRIATERYLSMRART